MAGLRSWTPLCLALAGLMGACGRIEADRRSPTLFLPPTPASTPLPRASPTPIPIPPSPTPPCTDHLLFQADLTIPDGTVVQPGQTLDKQWLLENAGTCNWDDRYSLRLISGSALGAPLRQALYPARSGTQLLVHILFTAPEEPGTYRSAWQAYDPQGQPFGDPFYMEIVVAPE